MVKKMQQGTSRPVMTADSSPFLCAPVEVADRFYEFSPRFIDTDGPQYVQPWSGYHPECTLEDPEACRSIPVQKANIRASHIYAGIEVEGDEWMRMACDEARASIDRQGGPFGAVILQIDNDTNRILRYWRNRNQVTAINDPTAHAEVMTIRSACASLGVFNLGCIPGDQSALPQPGATSHCVMYSSTEPCPMCYAAICWANIPMLMFAATRFDAAAPGVHFSDEDIYRELERPYAERKMRVYQCTVDNSLDAFNLWKRSEKTTY